MSFRLGKTRITLDFWLPALLTAYALLDRQGQLIYSLAAAGVHELGHILALLLQRQKPDSLSFTAHGMLIGTGKPLTVLTCAGGAAANALLFAALLPAYALGLEQAMPAAAANAVMGALCLLPVRPFDGAQMLSLLLWRYEWGEPFCSAVSIVCGTVLCAAGLLVLLRSRGNFSLLLLALWLLSAIFDKALDSGGV